MFIFRVQVEVRLKSLRQHLPCCCQSCFSVDNSAAAGDGNIQAGLADSAALGRQDMMLWP